MKKNILLATLVASVVLISCKKKDTAAVDNSSTQTEANKDSLATGANAATSDIHSAQNSIEWDGTYEGTLPCADCQGVKTTVVLNKDNTATVSEEYLGKNNKSDGKGNFTWDQAGAKISLNVQGFNKQFQIGEGYIVQLDSNGNEITGPTKEAYILKKK